MNLIIDIGNSIAKIAVTNNGEVVASYSYADITCETIENILDEFGKIGNAIISSTRKWDDSIERCVRSRVGNTIVFNHETPVPLRNMYKTPQTLGMDRLAAAVGAWSVLPNEELLIFDMGTAITIDRVTAAGEYVGGNISPGMKMRFAALNQFTGKLPLVSYGDHAGDCEEIFGQNTTGAIWNGVIQGIKHEIEGYIRHNPTAKLFFTGGDVKYFEKCQEKPIFANSELVRIGLERIIKYNAKKNNS